MVVAVAERFHFSIFKTEFSDPLNSGTNFLKKKKNQLNVIRCEKFIKTLIN